MIALAVFLQPNRITAALVNGSFESGNFQPTFFPPSGGGGMRLYPGATDIDGWSVVQGQIGWCSSGYEGITASDGEMFLDFTGWWDRQPFGGVTLASALETIPGHEYRLSFDLGSDTRFTSVEPRIHVVAGNSSASFTATYDGASHWDHLYFDFVASSSSTMITIAGEPPPDYSLFIGLDNLSLEEIGSGLPGPDPQGVPETPSVFVALCLLLPIALHALCHSGRQFKALSNLTGTPAAMAS